MTLDFNAGAGDLEGTRAATARALGEDSKPEQARVYNTVRSSFQSSTPPSQPNFEDHPLICWTTGASDNSTGPGNRAAGTGANKVVIDWTGRYGCAVVMPNPPRVANWQTDWVTAVSGTGTNRS